MKYLLSFFISFIFLACGGSSPEPLAYPSWYLNPPQNSSSFLYGVGEGKDIATAKASALSSVSASLSTTVSSELKQTQSSHSVNGEESTSRSAISSLKTEVKAMEFSDYQVTQNQVLGNTFLVLVKVSRAQLYKDQKNKLERFALELQEERNNIKKSAPLKQVMMYDKTVQKTDKLKSLALITKTVNSSFNPHVYLEQISQLKTEKEDALNSLRVKVHTSPEAKVFMDAVKEGLNKAGIKSVTSKANTDIYLKSSFLNDEVYGYKISKATLSLSTKADNKTIASNTVVLSGKSRYNYTKAKLNSAQVLRKKIKSEGLFTILGIK